MGQQAFRLEDGAEAYAAALGAVAAALEAGGLALLPAEGLYGLHAAGTAQGVARLAGVKGGPQTRPYILLLSAPEEAERWVSHWPGGAAQLARRVWPGALTLVLPAARRAPPWVQREGYLALRCPGCPFLRDVTRRLSAPLLTTSANPAGAPPPGQLAAVAGALRAACRVVVDGGRLAGVGSTVARPEEDGSLTILRRGLWEPPAEERVPR